ncbi:hypothetical protein Tco_0522087 [Tanacetum coccineum]
MSGSCSLVPDELIYPLDSRILFATLNEEDYQCWLVFKHNFGWQRDYDLLYAKRKRFDILKGDFLQLNHPVVRVVSNFAVAAFNKLYAMALEENIVGVYEATVLFHCYDGRCTLINFTRSTRTVIGTKLIWKSRLVLENFVFEAMKEQEKAIEEQLLSLGCNVNEEHEEAIEEKFLSLICNVNEDEAIKISDYIRLRNEYKNVKGFNRVSREFAHLAKPITWKIKRSNPGDWFVPNKMIGLLPRNGEHSCGGYDYHNPLKGRPIVVLGLREGLLGANPIPHRLARGVQFGTRRAVWHEACSLARGVQFSTCRAVWHEPEQFSSELNNISLELYTVHRCVQMRYTLTKWYQEPGYDKQWQKTRTDTKAEGTIEGSKQNINKSKSWKIGEIKLQAEYHVRIGMIMLASKGNVRDVQKVDIYFCKLDGLGKQKNISFIMSVKTRKLQRLEQTAAGVAVGMRILEEEWQGKDTSLAHLKVAAQMKCHTVFGIRRVTRLSEAEILHLWTRFMEPENDSIVLKHRLSSEITQSPGGCLDTSEGSENSGSFEDNGRSGEEYSEDGASSKEGGSETPQVRRSTKESRAPVRNSPLSNYLLLTENGEPESYSEALSSKEFVQWKKAINEEMVSLEKNQMCSLVRLPARKKASQRLWMFKVKEEQDGRKSCEDDYNQVSLEYCSLQELHLEQLDVKTTFLHADLDKDIYMIQSEGFSVSWERRKPSVQVKEKSIRIKASTETMVDDMLVAGSDMAEFNKPKCDVDQVGDEREVKVLLSFNWPPSELITEDGVLPERGYSQFNDVSSGCLVSKVS